MNGRANRKVIWNWKLSSEKKKSEKEKHNKWRKKILFSSRIWIILSLFCVGLISISSWRWLWIFFTCKFLRMMVGIIFRYFLSVCFISIPPRVNVYSAKMFRVDEWKLFKLNSHSNFTPGKQTHRWVSDMILEAFTAFNEYKWKIEEKSEFPCFFLSSLFELFTTWLKYGLNFLRSIQVQKSGNFHNNQKVWIFRWKEQRVYFRAVDHFEWEKKISQTLWTLFHRNENYSPSIQNFLMRERASPMSSTEQRK